MQVAVCGCASCILASFKLDSHCEGMGEDCNLQLLGRGRVPKAAGCKLQVAVFDGAWTLPHPKLQVAVFEGAWTSPRLKLQVAIVGGAWTPPPQCASGKLQFPRVPDPHQAEFQAFRH